MHRDSAIPGRVRLSAALLDAVEKVLPDPDAPGIATGAVHERVGGWNRTTVRHALRELVRQGRAGFTGRDRRRRYQRGGGIARPPEPSAPDRQARPRPAAARGADSSLLPGARGVETALCRLRIRYRDVDAGLLLREERLAGWGWHKRSSAELTRAVFGDPEPGRVVHAPPRRLTAAAQHPGPRFRRRDDKTREGGDRA